MQSYWLLVPLIFSLALGIYFNYRLGTLNPKNPKFIRYIGFALLFTAISWQFFFRMGRVGQASWFQNSYSMLGAVLLGWMGTFLILAIPLDLGYTVLRLFQRFSQKNGKNHDSQIDVSRRHFFQQATGVGVASLSTVTTSIGFHTARKGPDVTEVEVPIPNLHPDLVGLRIAQISDLHVGPTIQKNYVEAVVERTLQLKADLIAVTGDLVDGLVENLAPQAEPLRKLEAPLGIYYTTGNHEYYWGAEPWIQHVQKMGWIHLQNENRVIKKGQAKLLVGGVTDTSGHQFYPTHQSSPKAAANSNDSVDCRVLLAHRPSSCFEAAKAGFDLQLSGHTHAGQFFPWSLFVPLAHPYYKGLNLHEKKMWVYVNRGTGYWGPPNRFGIPSEISLIILKEGSSQSLLPQ